MTEGAATEPNKGPKGNRALLITAWVLAASTCCLWSPFAALVLFVGSLDTDRVRNPPVTVLPVPEGTSVTASGGSYGSGRANLVSAVPSDRRSVVDKMVEAMRASGWTVSTNDDGEITATSAESVTAAFSYSGDRFDFETSGFAIDVAEKKERIIRIDLSYPNDGVGWNVFPDIGWITMVTIVAATAIVSVLVAYRISVRRRSTTHGTVP